MRAHAALLFVATLLLAAMAGCVSSEDLTPTSAGGGADAAPRHALDMSAFDTSGPYSRTLTEGPFDIMPAEVLRIPGVDDVTLSAGLYLPKMNDNTGMPCRVSGDVPEECRVPVIIDAGPYYGNGDVTVDKPANRLGKFLIENFVPHGYAVVQLSVRGTGWSEGCSDFLGPKEQADLNEAVTFFGEAPWSNGKVGMIGRSYDGTTPWEAATFGNPHLATIVPISGLSDVGAMYFRNGSSEFRAPFLGTIYSSFAVEAEGRDDAQRLSVLCPETAEHPMFGTSGYLTGGQDVPASEYWKVRNYQPRVLENYEGSVFLIHGLQDWNVDPHMAFPFASDLVDAGIETKVLAGQWEHNYPDREHKHLRWDWAEQLLAWFDSELKGLNVDTGPAVESEDNYGNWRASTAWPPATTEWSTLYLSGEGDLAMAPGEGGEATLVDPYSFPVPGSSDDPTGVASRECTSSRVVGDDADWANCLTFHTGAVADDMRIVGLPRLHVTVTPTTNGGQLYAELYEFQPDSEESILIGHAQMDLRYHAGGKEAQTVAPGQPVVAKMEFFPMDALVKEGSHLKLVLRQSHPLEPLPAAQQSPVTVQWGEDASTLQLPIGPTGGVFHVSEGVDPESTWA